MNIDNRLILPFSGHDDTRVPIVIERGEGVYLYDTDGKEYIDAFSSLWTTILGHNHPKITEAIISQARRVSHATLYGQAHKPSIELTDKLLEFVELPEHHVLFANSGSEAVESAIKAVVSYWERAGENLRKNILTFRNSYHGETCAAMTASGFDSHGELFPGLVGNKTLAASSVQTKLEIKNGVIYDDPSYEGVFAKMSTKLAAVILEPVYGAGGVLFPPKEFLNQVVKMAKELGIPVIVDEVATGFYRMGSRFVFQELDFEPDVLVLGKALSGGYLPMSATLFSPKIAATFDRKNMQPPLMHGHTHAGNPLACAAAKASIGVLESSDFQEKISSITPVFNQQIEGLKHFTVAEIRQKGLFAGIEILGEDSTVNWGRITKEICYESKRNGVLIRPLGNIIVVAPPAIMSEHEVVQISTTIRDAIQKITHKYV